MKFDFNFYIKIIYFIIFIMYFGNYIMRIIIIKLRIYNNKPKDITFDFNYIGDYILFI